MATSMNTFKHSGKNGDCIFSLPAIRALGGGVVYLPKDGCETPGFYDNIKSLLEAQPYITEVREYPSGLAYGQKAPGIHIDYDLDIARQQPGKGVIHIVRRYLDAFHVNLPDWKEPWLTVPGEIAVEKPYTVINYTGRHIKNDHTGEISRVDWRKVALGIETPIFIGFEEEYTNFLKMTNWAPVSSVYPKDALQFAQAIKYSQAVYCNQSFCMALSQSMGKELYGAFKPNKTNCKLFTPNEHELI